MNVIVTTTQSKKGIDSSMQLFLENIEFEYVPRMKKSLQLLMEEKKADGVIVWETGGPILYIENEKFFFHPSMAKNRIAAYRKKSLEDLMIKACELREGDSFLDCTLGLGADAIVASYFSKSGRITGLESSTALAYVVKWGMNLYKGQMSWLNEAVHRIEVFNENHINFLTGQQDKAYDIVYFDPMFRKPLLKSKPISPLRRWANKDALSIETINEACRVAQKRVVMKEQRSSGEFERLGFTRIVGSRRNPIAYGVIEV